MAATSKAAIDTLLMGGWNKTQIAHFLGRDVSLVSQVSRGIKPGANLLPALNSLISAGASPGKALMMSKPEIETRQQRVRQGVKTVGTGLTPQEQALHVTSGGEKTVIKALRAAEARGQKVQITPDFTNVKRKHGSGKKRGRAPRKVKEGGVPIGEKGGRDPGKLADAIERDGLAATMKSIAQQNGNIERVGSFRRVEVHSYIPSGE